MLLPIVRPPDFLPFAVRSVLAQTARSFELVIVCDGAPGATVAEAERLAETDDRVRVAAFAKGARHGEAHRATVLEGARGVKVAHLGDDDLWFPDHLEVLGRLLDRVDFGNVLQMRVLPDGALWMPASGHLRDRSCRERMARERWNFFGPTEAGYRMTAYRGLPRGWSPAPEDIYSDLHMWRAFLAQPGLRVGSTFAATALKFGARQWDGLPTAALTSALGAYEARLGDAEERTALRAGALDAAARKVRPRYLSAWIAEDPASGIRAARLRVGGALARRFRGVASRVAGGAR